MTRGGRPRGPLSAEYSEVLRLYDGTRSPAQIGAELGLTRDRVSVIVQDLRRRGAIPAGLRAPAESRWPRRVDRAVIVTVAVPQVDVVRAQEERETIQQRIRRALAQLR
ncbi:MAG: hypothetical protein ACRCU1_18585 [Alsobacter sp.]